MMRTRTGALTGYLGETDQKLVMLRPREITGTRAYERDGDGMPWWAKTLLGLGALVGVGWMLSRR